MLVGAHAQAAAAVLEAFPPRGITRLLPAEHTSHGKPQIERLVAEEYILDTIIFFEGDRVQCAQHLASESSHFSGVIWIWLWTSHKNASRHHKVA